MLLFIMVYNSYPNWVSCPKKLKFDVTIAIIVFRNVRRFNETFRLCSCLCFNLVLSWLMNKVDICHMNDFLFLFRFCVLLIVISKFSKYHSWQSPQEIYGFVFFKILLTIWKINTYTLTSYLFVDITFL